MKVLVLAPHPFYQDRGTPIDVLLVLKVLAERPDYEVDLLVYNEGHDVDLPHLHIYRTPHFSFTQGIKPGFSLKKLVCDGFMFLMALLLIARQRYDVIHAGEESVYIAIVLSKLVGIPYVYDLDSSIAQQMVEGNRSLKLFSPLFEIFERYAIRNSLANLPVCNALHELCEKCGSKKTVTIHDISQLTDPDAVPTGLLREECGGDWFKVLYIGNLEPYQGIDLLLDGFRLVCERTGEIHLVVIGGSPQDILKYRAKSVELGIMERTHFLGPRPFDRLDRYLCEADVLVAPRVKGVNTPMKIFPYLHSGKPVLLTDLYTHTQLLSSNEAYLAAPTPEGMAHAIIELAGDGELRERLGRNGRRFVESGHTYEAHQRRVHGVYDWIEQELEVMNYSCQENVI